MVDTNDLKFIEEQLGRKPNDVEIAMFENLWSEHCAYRSSKNLLKMFGRTVKENPDMIVGPGDDAAIIRLDKDICVSMAMESHNHPSYIDPYNGSATGVGGIVRDIISMNSKPIALLDALRFGDIQGKEKDKVKWLVDGVMSGIGDYGNRIGVPTVGGECEFDSSYDYNNLVNVVAIGLVNENEIVQGKAKEEGLSIILVGDTGKDGIGGASFASKDLTSESEGDRPSVQIGDAFKEKKLIDATLEACKTGNVMAMKDLGAAGITSSCSEMCFSGGVGAELHLENVFLREAGMTPYEIMISESQERNLFAVKAGSEEELLAIFEKYELPCAVIGKTTDTKRLIAYHNEKLVVDLPLELLCEAPLYDMPEKEDIKEKPENKEKIESDAKTPNNKEEHNETLKKMLESPNICSKSNIYERYDHEVQVRTVVKPGKDAAVLKVQDIYPMGVALTADCNSTYSKLNAYEAAKTLVCESVRNLATVGARPIGMLDNLNFGNPEKPERYWQLKKSIEGLTDSAEFLNIPVVGGNVSLYNETIIEGKDYPINPTPTISIIGKVKDVELIPNVMIKPKENDVLLLIGETKEEMGGSEYYKVIHNTEDGFIPKVDLKKEMNTYNILVDLIENGLINEAIDLSRGGLAIALSKMTMNTNLGVDIALNSNLSDCVSLYSESSGRILIAVNPEIMEYVISKFSSNEIFATKLGVLTAEKQLKVELNSKEIINISSEDIKESYYNGFPKLMGEL
ncbi:phosphoribosylformylglycinamidine synthase subunit PurL [Methanococcus voltae]|uniref:Phosphoribosylformylglycinamidine synthase subunit PurL n=1 Tax=Methanococcus voltae (strain ATCC BAA-1334 / A3) TaxID=456320 RepID=D7DR60_METV3|nr:phosphoribosylformylglycinamidine synthase subunit PurL [Methanococcus voltae]MCS3900997.1 phosphoribosylformylglycinamidine synthase [Methanococcus voltae]